MFTLYITIADKASGFAPMSGIPSRPAAREAIRPFLDTEGCCFGCHLLNSEDNWCSITKGITNRIALQGELPYDTNQSHVTAKQVSAWPVMCRELLAV